MTPIPLDDPKKIGKELAKSLMNNEDKKECKCKNKKECKCKSEKTLMDMPELENDQFGTKADKYISDHKTKIEEGLDHKSDLMQMPELESEEYDNSKLKEDLKKIFGDRYYLIPKGSEQFKNMHDLNTFQCCENELYLRGKDEFGEDFTICFDAFNFLEWIDTDQIKYIKKRIKKYIDSK